MTSPLDRPLTWLFWIAVVALNLVIVTGASNFWIEVLIVGQAFVIAAWAALGRLHRLAAAASVVLSIPILTAIVELEDVSNESTAEWRWVLAAVALLSIACAVAICLWRFILRLTFGSRARSRRFHFPLIELFGWTIVVAVASVLLREAIFRAALTATIIPWIFTAAVAALMAAFFLAPERPRILVATTISLVAVMTDLGLKNNVWREDQATAAGIYLFVAVWILLTRLDDSIARQSAGDPQDSGATGGTPLGADPLRV